MTWTLLRPTGFMQNTLAWGPRVLDGTFYSPVPDAAFSIVDARDVAEVAAVALTEEGHENKAYGLSGPEAVSYREQARRVFAAAGREVTVEEIAVETLKRELVRAGVPPWNAEGLSELFELYAGGGAQMVTSGVKDTLARDPRSLDDFAKDRVATTRGFIPTMFSKTLSPQELQWMQSEVMMTPSVVAGLLYYDGWMFDSTETVKKLKVPQLYFISEGKTGGAKTFIARYSPDAELVSMGQHAMFYDHADVFNARLAGFLAKHP